MPSTYNVELKAEYIYRPSRLSAGTPLEWKYDEDFQAGDQIFINNERKEVTHNGLIINEDVTGEFPFFNPSKHNTVTWKDSEADRSVKFQVIWRGRWL